MNTVESRRSNPVLVASAIELFDSPQMQDMLAILETENSFADVLGDAPEVASVRALSYGAGWHACLTTLRSFAVSTTPQLEEPEPTYPPPEPVTP